MILVADSGATKTDWILTEPGKEWHKATTGGIQPFYQTVESMAALLHQELPREWIRDSMVETVFFYGAGCGSTANQEKVKDSLSSVFPYSYIHVNSDLLGSGIALYGTAKGLAAILGTGSNVGWYEGQEITRRSVSLGYLFGDEGSGAHLGKSFLSRYLRGEWAQPVRQAFEEYMGMTDMTILSKLYGSPFPNRILAGIAVFLESQWQHEEIRAMVRDCFDAFFRIQVLPLLEGVDSRRVGFTGSIAAAFAEPLHFIADQHSIMISGILKSPVQVLAGFHGDEVGTSQRTS